MKCALTRQAMRLLIASILTLLTLPLSVGQGQEEEWPGVDGATYRSPNFGYTLTWDESWVVRDAYAGPPDDGLTLTNGMSTVMIIGTQAFAGDHRDCLQATIELLNDTWDDVGLASDSSGAPLVGEEESLA